MKTLALLAVVLVVGSSGFLIKVPKVPSQPRPGSPGKVHLQKLILPLFDNVCEDSLNPVIVRLAQEFTLDSSSALYLKPEVVNNLKALKAKGLLPKGEIFTDYNIEHLSEFRAIYEVLFYAKDFDTFFKAAAWARQNVNCGLFIRAIYLAVLNRRDTEKLSVPGPYELFPNYFIPKDVIVKASSLLTDEEIVLDDSIHDEGNSYVLDANYTSDFIKSYDETKLAYFHEDIGINTYYFLQKLQQFPWFYTAPDSSRCGEYFYHTIKQLIARYDLERYGNGLPEVESIELNTLTARQYNPMLIYSNGQEFGYRTTSMDLTNSDNLQILQTIENNIPSVVAHLRETGLNKTQILNHLMGILITGERSFETVLRFSLGKDDTFTDSQPSVLDHFATSLRDPIFWKINKKIVDLVDDALKEIPVYTRNELYFPGVEIINVDVKKLMTNFDYFQFDVTDALKTDTINTAFQVKIGQPRLNHKPFVVKLNVSSLVTEKGLIKIYLGPKTAPGELTKKKNMFMLLDSFEYNFRIGSNVVSRSSEQMTHLADDFTSLRTLRKKVEDAEFGLDALPMKNVESWLGFPNRLILPKGTPEGLPLQIFAFVAPFVKSTFSRMFAIPNVEFNSVILSPGYPLDLDIYDDQLFDLPNAIVKDIFVTHKGDKVAGDSKKFSKGPDDPSSQSEYAAQKNEPFDYSAKKAQYGRKEGAYGKQEDYASKREYYKGKNTDYKIEDVLIEPEVTVKKSNEDVDSKKSTYSNEINYDFGELEPVHEQTVFLQNLDVSKDNILTETYTKKPSVYDYILNTGDYYDEVDVSDRVYE